MKKVLSGLLVSLAISGSCFAAGSAQSFAAEERMADNIVSALTGNSVSFEEISKSFAANMKQGFNAERFANMKKQIKDKIGTVRNVNFVSFTRQYNLKNGYTNVDNLVYFGNAGKDKYARFVIYFVVEEGAQKVSAFDVTPINAAPEQNKGKK